jgi:ferredoxin
MTMRVIVDTEKCAGFGVCENIIPEVYQVGDDGLTHVLTEELTEDMRVDLEASVAECPRQALRLVD